jgi:P-type Cu2+ transporter
VQAVNVNAATARVAVDWTGRGANGLAQILEAVARAGFKPIPLAGDAAAEQYRREHRAALKRVGLASIGMMQAMMYLGALYGASDIDASMAQLMRVAGMVIVTPVLFYSGAPFFIGAWRDISSRRLGMDVPVALALAIAFVPSVINTFRGAGEVYFDSVGMFVFFLCVGRFIEMTVRHRGLSTAEALARSQPAQVTLLAADGTRRKVAAADVRAGDRFVVPKGGVIAVDARLPADCADTRARVDESLVTGESAAVIRGAGQSIRGGSINLGDPLTLVASAPAATSTLATMVALLERAQGERPRIAHAADRAASWFVAVILVLAVLTAVYWWFNEPARAFSAVLAVLVVSCPCALSLAMPAAFAAATTRLARSGVLLTRADAIERLAQTDIVVFDKTGTLTAGASGVTAVLPLANIERDHVLALAAALESGSAHPLAQAFAGIGEGMEATDTREVTGQGVEGVIGGRRWRLGRLAFVQGLVQTRSNIHALERSNAATIYLGDETGTVAAIEIGVPLRTEAASAMEQLRALGVEISIASGDQLAPTTNAARELGVRNPHARLSPQDKLWLVQHLRECGHRVCMVGDGINDGPVLAAAHVSCAMGRGSAIAQSAADVLLVNEDLRLVPRAVAVARAAMRVVRQNLGWSLVYNFTAVPLAALGLVPPWVAALGMSLSSLGVVLNARRLAGEGRPS